MNEEINHEEVAGQPIDAPSSTQPSESAAVEEPEVQPATTQTPLSEPAPPPLSDTDALTAARLMQLLSEAEERGYMRARRELDASRPSPLGSEVPLWENPRRIEAENAEQHDRVELDGEFLSRVRPAIWD